MAVPALLWLGARRDGPRRAERARRTRRSALLVVDACCSPTRAARSSPRASAARCGSRSSRCACAASPCCARRRSAGASSACGPSGRTALSQDSVPPGAARRRRARARDPRRAMLLVAAARAASRSNFSLAERAPARRLRAPRVGRSRCSSRSRSSRSARGRRARDLAAGWPAASRKGWQRPHEPERAPPANDPTPPHRDRQRARALLGRGAADLRREHEAVGVGAGGYRDRARCAIRQDTLNVRHAHGYVVQTVADLGLVGLAISARAARRVARGRGAHDRPVAAATRRAPYTPERIGMLTPGRGRRRLRRALVRRLDVVRPGQRRARAAARGLGRRARRR